MFTNQYTHVQASKWKQERLYFYSIYEAFRKYCFLLSVHLAKKNCQQNRSKWQNDGFSHSGLSVDASVGFSQSLDDLQSVEQLVGAFDPQELLPAQTLPILHRNTHSVHLCPTDTTYSNLNVWLHCLFPLHELNFCIFLFVMFTCHRNLQVYIKSALYFHSLLKVVWGSVVTDRVIWDVLEGLKHLGTCGKKHQQLPNPPGQILCVEVKLLTPCTLL